jgi:hypothetical protein
MRRVMTATAAAAATAALLGPAATATADPQAKAAGEEVISFVTKGKLKLGKTISYQFVCGVACNVKADVSIALPGPNFNSTPVTATNIPAGQVLEDKLKPNGPLLKAIKADKGRAKLQATITGTNVATGEVDVDKASFKFK